MRIGSMVTAQENACRYCYGANRAYMKVLGYSEAFIQSVERDVQLAETDPRELAFIEFCRSLARSRPRPSRGAREKLLSLGYSAPEIAEMAFHHRHGLLLQPRRDVDCLPARSRSSNAWPTDPSGA